MADLDGIIRFRKWELDEKRRELAALFVERMQLEQAIEAIENEMLEQKAMRDSEVASMTLGAYIEGARIKKAWLVEGLRKKDEDIAEKQDVVSEAFRELKTFEIADGRQRERQARELQRQEQNELDDLGLKAFENNAAHTGSD